MLQADNIIYVLVNKRLEYNSTDATAEKSQNPINN